MKLKLIDTQEDFHLSDALFNLPYNEGLIHQIVTAQLAYRRQGTKAQKTRGEVRGSTRKLWKQKGTGRARVGGISNPLWRSGGVIFAAKPRDYSQKVNRKMYRGALRHVFSELIRTNRLLVFEDLGMQTYKTKELVSKLQQYEVEKGLIIEQDPSKNLTLAAQNLFGVQVLKMSHVTLVDLIGAPKTLISRKALFALEERLGC